MTRITEDIAKAGAVLRDGGVVLCPTEGVYGLSCNPFCDEAVKRIIALKKRDTAKGLIIVGSSYDQIRELVCNEKLTERHREMIASLWPGPYTFILPVSRTFSRYLMGAHSSLAIRVTAFDTMRRLCDLAESPLVSTSANLSGQQEVSSFAELNESLFPNVDIVLKLPCGGLNMPTSIYDTLSDRLLRRGAVWPF